MRISIDFYIIISFSSYDFVSACALVMCVLATTPHLLMNSLWERQESAHARHCNRSFEWTDEVISMKKKPGDILNNNNKFSNMNEKNDKKKRKGKNLSNTQ